LLVLAPLAQSNGSGSNHRAPDVVDDVPHGLKALQILIRKGDTERVLSRDCCVDERERVDTKVLSKALGQGHSGRVHFGDLLQYPSEGRLNVILLHSSFPPVYRLGL
jgi:hypothetical protein